MAKVKFKVGDKVRYSKRCAKWIQGDFRGRTRTIIGAYWDEKDQATLYDLGRRGKGSMGRLFRSYELVKANNLHKRGKPPLD